MSEPLWRYEDAVRDNPKGENEGSLEYIERIVAIVERRQSKRAAPAVRLPYREPGSDDE